MCLSVCLSVLVLWSDLEECIVLLQVTVFFVDYGNQATVEASEIRTMPHAFLSVPAQVSLHEESAIVV